MSALANITHVPMELMEPITKMINTPKDECKCGPQLRMMFIFRIACGLILFMSIFVIMGIKLDKFHQKENIKSVKFGRNFPVLKGGERLYVVENNGTRHEGTVAIGGLDSHIKIVRDGKSDGDEKSILWH